ncbi:aminotransferase class I/II-fold pyridoxal phosphate-dependent enzyme [Chryseobacterium nematophagum]|uniref:Aminotransferase n=1 Tax=Chryseobacterium nematophagum TaxID=2305228 RepID=A0A3M7TCY6_9FLAO|nr:aminotransferase class I/II-fold pyridoxal phosphate-dependent enzyme [Chryseobacterium nematophagum]
MYRYLQHKGNDNLPPACDLYENAISFWGTAKTFGLAGLRLGWLCSKNTDILKKIESFKDYLSLCSSAPSEVLTTIALNNHNYFCEINIHKINKNIELFKKFHENHGDKFDFFYPDAGSTSFIRLKLEDTALEFSQRLVKDTNIMLLPSETFEYGSHHARIGFGRRNFQQALDILDKYLKFN